MKIEYAVNDDGHFTCTFKGCNEVKKNRSTMFYHMKRHLKEFSYKCEDCDKGFIQKSAFLHHMAAIHPGNDEITIPDKVVVSDVINKLDTNVVVKVETNVVVDVGPKPSSDDGVNVMDKTVDKVVDKVVDKTIDKTVDKTIKTVKIKNPYDGQSFKCPCCEDVVTRTKANALVHYARLHAKDWIPTYNKDKGCPDCNRTFGSIAAYLYHCTGCIPANKTHCELISLMIDKTVVVKTV